MHLIIDGTVCEGCGRCEAVCIRGGVSVVDGTARENPDGDCFDCGHCMAVCPRAAIRLALYDVAPEDLRLPWTVPSDEGLLALISVRRSHRWFTDEPVTDGDLEEMMRAAAQTPYAQNARDVEFAAVRDDLDGFMRLLAGILEPVAGEYPRIAQFEEYMKSPEGPNPLIWEGRCVMLSFAEEPIDAVIAMTRVELISHAMGLGGFYSLWISKAEELDHERLMSFFPGIDGRKRLGAVYVLGYPRITYRRMAPKPLPRLHMLR